MIAKFKKTNRGLALAAVLFAGLGLITLTDASSGSSHLAKDLIGTWILVGKPGEFGQAPAAGGRLKFWTGTHWCITQADPKNGVVIFHHGGTYTLKGDNYLETVEFANPSTKDRIGKTGKYTLKIEGETLTQIGIGNPWREVWKRAKCAKPHPADATVLQGSWSGQETGGRSKGACSLVIKGSNLEFHGADTNEWYKAAFSAYDTTPKQVVITITDCPFPDYVGISAYAIYQLQDGTLTMTGNEPGSPVVPADFDAPGARKIVFKREAGEPGSVAQPAQPGSGTNAEQGGAGTTVAGAPPTNPNEYKPSTDKDESAACKKNLEKINAAIEAYRKDHHDVPNWLSDLVPKYLPDTNLLVCPVTTRTGQQSPFGVLDPKIYSSYLYEFTPTPIPEVVKGAWPGPQMTMREWKRQQMKLVGPEVPLVRCLLHEPALNLSLGGKVYESPVFWELNFTNVAKLEAFSPH
ncbi:MAG: hypothetical protein ABSD29_18975 [Verrucomicrobiota bacterium]